MATSHANMDKEASSRQYRMLDAAHCRDTNRLWGLIIVCTEAAFITRFGLKDAPAKSMTGRNKVTFQDGNTENKQQGERK